MVARALLAFVLLAGAVGCGDDGHDDLLVFAAASLTDAFAELEDVFESARPGVDVALNLAGSSTLREQILQGAPAEVFASADRANMDRLVEAGVVEEMPTVFAHNRLELVVPADNPGAVAGLADLADPGLLVGLCAEGVPCGDLARRALAAAGVAASVDTEEPDVRALLTKVAEGELDAGVVYTTDVRAAGSAVRGIAIPDEHEVAADYLIASLSGASDHDAARAFVDLVRSAEGQAILERHGLGPP